MFYVDFLTIIQHQFEKMIEFCMEGFKPSDSMVGGLMNNGGVDDFNEGSSFFLYLLLGQKQMKTNNFQGSKTVGSYTILLNEPLGKGATGIVYRGFQNFTKQSVAVKTIDLSTIKDDATKSLLENEKAALRAIKAPNIMRLDDIIEEEGFCYIITELCQGATLKEYLQKHKMLNQNEAMSIFRQLTAGSLAVSHQCIIHRDLKPANVMINSQGEIKIIDFGYCEIIMAKKVMRTFNVGSPSYMSPEAYHRTLYSQKSDSWSLGMILYQMLHGKTLDEGTDIKRYFEELKTDPNFISKRMAPHITLEVREIIEKALKYQTEERSSISNLKYLADKYHVNLRQKNINYSNLPLNQPSKQYYTQQMHSVPRMHNQNKFAQTGFVSFGDFVRHDSQKHGLIKMKQLTSLEDFDADTRKSSNSKGVAFDPKLNSFLQGTVKDPKRTKPCSSTSINAPFCRTQVVSVRDVTELPAQYPPLRKNVTVRFN